MDSPVVQKMTYKDERSSSYDRLYSNMVYVGLNAQDDITLDFCEEYAAPFVTREQSLVNDSWQPTFDRDWSEIDMRRLFKSTVILPKDVAVQLARLILAQAGDTEKDE